MPYPKFYRDQLLIRKLAERGNRVDIEKDNIPANREPSPMTDVTLKVIERTAERIKAARKERKPVILAFGAHAIKNGLAPVLNAMIADGWLSHLATNGAGIIHDWEFAYQGKTSEDVRENVGKGQFGIWEETGFYINLALVVGAYEGLGYGESIGKMIAHEELQIPPVKELYDVARKNMEVNPELASSAICLAGTIQNFRIKAGVMQIPHPFRKYSVQAAAFKAGIPFTGHPMIGHDIIYTHPMNNGAAVGRTALNDFLYFTKAICNFNRGVYISLGSAVMSPMIFEKAFSMAQNMEIQQNGHIDSHYMLVVDLVKSTWDWQKDGEPPTDNPAYYLRFCKTFSRMGGQMDYLAADNRDFLLALYHKLSDKH
jgi:hypothetical protein